MATSEPAAQTTKDRDDARRIIDALIEERAGRLLHNPAIWSAVRRLAYPLLGYRQAVDMAETIQNMRARAVFEHLSQRLTLNVKVRGIDHLPRQGPVLITANHPAGMADGVAIYDALKAVRPDVTFFANRDAIRVAAALDEMVVPVEWVAARRTRARQRETARATSRAFRSGRAVVLFPSGRLARPTWRGLVEREWQPAVISLARKYACPIVPLNVVGRNSWLYYALYVTNNELKDMMLFKELLNKAGRRYRLTFGAPVEPQALPEEPWAAAAALRDIVTGPLGRGEAGHPVTIDAS